MSEAWGKVIVGAFFAVMSIYFGVTGEILWRGGGWTRREQNPLLFWTALALFGGLGAFQLVEGLDSLGLLR